MKSPGELVKGTDCWDPPPVSDSADMGWGGILGFAFLTSSQVIQNVWGPHCEGHCLRMSPSVDEGLLSLFTIPILQIEKVDYTGKTHLPTPYRG